VRSWFFLLHPGPSLLVTLTFVAIAVHAAGGAVGAGPALRLVAIMLPIQFAIGAVNDVADANEDVAAKPWKPIPRGAIGRRGALAAGLALAMVGLVASATIGPATLGLVAGGLTAGLAYDLGARRTPLSWLPWWVAFTLLPLAAYTAVGIFVPRLLIVMPLALLVALPLHCANALPDLDADRQAGVRSLPVVLGRHACWRVIAAGPCLAAAIGTLAAWGTQLRWPVLAAALVLLVATVSLAVRRPRRPFPAVAVAVACFAVVWLSSLPS
jgi:4-hydroxybenzoate polyprenyltransferase